MANSDVLPTRDDQFSLWAIKLHRTHHHHADRVVVRMRERRRDGRREANEQLVGCGAAEDDREMVLCKHRGANPRRQVSAHAMEVIAMGEVLIDGVVRARLHHGKTGDLHAATVAHEP